MIQLIRLKDRIMQFVGRFEVYVMAGVRFVIGYAAFRLIIMNLGYNEVLTEYPIALLAALLCCFLPSGVMLFFAALFILIELYSLSSMLCLIVGLIFLIMFCAYTRFTSRKGLYAVLTPIMSLLGVPYTMPVVCGLRREPYAVISVICGEITYFMLKHITFNATLYVVSEDDNATSVLTMAVSELLLDQEMYLYLIGFAAAAIVTFCVGRLRVKQSHLIASAVGILTQIAIIYGGETQMMKSQTELTRILLGCVVSFLILLIVSFFTYNLNYKRVENVQFEDDDYYYFVRAVPKAFPQPKRWNPQQSSRIMRDEDDQEEIERAAAARRTGTQRSVKREPERKTTTQGSVKREPERKTTTQGSVKREPERKTATQGSVKRDQRKPVEKSTVKDTNPEPAVIPEEPSTKLAAEAAAQAAAAAQAERAASQAVADRAAAAAQAISEAAGQTASSQAVSETAEQTAASQAVSEAAGQTAASQAVSEAAGQTAEALEEPDVETAENIKES